MGFVWKSLMCARDLRDGATIRRVNRFEDIGPEGSQPFSYSQGDLEFEFRALALYEWRMGLSHSSAELQRVHTSTSVFEVYIRNGLRQSGRLSISSEEYRQLKQKIAEGMLVLQTNGGYFLHYTPDFRVEVVDTPDYLYKLPSRPENPGTARSASRNEGPVMLGDKKNIAFVYMDGEACDADKRITITRIRKLEETSLGDPTPYIYSDDNRSFEFRASQFREWRKSSVDGIEKILWPHTTTYVIEDSIKQGMAAAGCRAFTAEEYQVLRQNIEKGMWTIETSNGSALKTVPDFRLEFVNAAKDAPRWPARPAS